MRGVKLSIGQGYVGTKKEKDEFLESYAELKSIPKTCEKYGIERDVFYYWLKRDKKYAARYFKIRDELFDRVKMTVLDTYMECGSITRACKIQGVAQSQFYNWVQGDQDYNHAYRIAKDLLHDRLKDKAVELAMGGNERVLIYLLEKMGRGDELAKQRWGPKEINPKDEFISLSDFKARVERVVDTESLEYREGVSEN